MIITKLSKFLTVNVKHDRVVKPGGGVTLYVGIRVAYFSENNRVT